MGKFSGKALGTKSAIVARFRYIAIVFGVFCWFSSVLAVTYEQVEPAKILKSASEHIGKFVMFQANFSHIMIYKTSELLSSATGAKVDLDAYDSFEIYGDGFVFPRMLMSKKKDSNLYELKPDTPVTIYGEVFRVNMVEEPIILVHKIERNASFP
ncbi:MAG: hypothetical protein ACUZ77_01100 [Candidatus Brocadiales bacterium]